MRASTAALCIGLLIAALTPVDASSGEPLRDLSATYAHKVGQAYQSEVSLLQYTVDFADELHTLEFVDCANKSYCPAVNTAQCAPCDYSDATSPSCGTSPRVPRGMNCSCPFRDALCYTPDPYFLHRGSLVLNQPLRIEAQAQGIVLLGVYIPEGFCQAVRVRVVSVNTNNVVSLGVRPDWSVASTGQQEALAFTPSSSSFPPRWTSQRSYSPYVTYCPSDYTSFRSAGTWFVAINLADNFINATVLAELLPLPDGPTPPFVPLPQYPDYNVLRTDNLYTVTPGSDTTKFVIGVTGPCPRFVGVSVAGFPYVLSRVYTTLGISLTNPDPLNSAGVDSWVDGDWSSVIAISFCPNDTSAVSVVNIGVQANTLFLLALYVTTNPQRFFARPVLSTTIAPTAYSVADTLFHAVALQCNSADGPVTFRPCTVSYGAGLSHCAPSLSMNAPLAVAAPTWPPFPYIVRGLYNSPPADLNESFIPARLSFSLAYSVRQMSSLGLMDMRALTRLDFGSCAVYLHPNIVTKERRARSTTDPIRGLRPVQGQCEHDRFMKLSSEIINILNLISPLIPPLQRTQYSIDLDYLHFTDDWQNCVALAESLLTIDEISLPQMTTTCTEFSRDSLDPCCSFEGLWATGFCAPRMRATPQTLYQLNAEASDRCPGDCLSTYLQDYITAAQSSCVVVNLAPKSYSNNMLLPFAECQEELLFGLGTPCIHDSDCAFGFCDYAAGTCVQPLENLYSTFVDCVLTRSDPGLVFQLQTVVLQLSADLPPAELKSAVLRAFLEWDCVEPFFLSPKQAHSRLIQDVSFVTDVICPLEFVLTVHATIYPLCSDHAGVSYGSDSTPQFSCPTQPACDWNPFVTNASLCSRSPPHCYYCFTSDYCLPILGVSSQAQCEQQAIGCQLRDGSLAFVSGASLDALAAECANASTCSFCTLPGGCDTSAECLSPQNGYCTDGTDFYHYEGNATVPGACVLPIDWNSDCSMWHDTINLTNPLIPAQSVLLARPIGCISRSITTPKKCASFTRVSTLSGLLLQPTWHVPATTPAECAAHGRACVSPTMVDFLSQPLGYLTVQFVRPPLLNGTQFQDQMCGDLEVTSYYTWMSALWEGGVVRNLRWQAPRMQQDYFYQRSFIVENFAIAMTHAVYSLYTLNLLSADQCRFNRRIMALEAVSCACGAANSSCLDAVPTLPSASGFVCSTAQRFAAPPLSFTFYAADLHGCTPVTMFHVSPLNFGSLAPPQALSTYWTKPSHEFAGLTFSNELGAAVGEVVGTGFLLNSSNSLTRFSVWACFPTPNFTQRSEFSVPDLAISPRTRATVTPQGLTVQIFAANSSWCVLVPALQTNVSYVPVMRAPDWQTRHPGSMSHKNRVALRVVSGFYFAGLAIAVLALVTVVTVHRLAGVMQVAFWLAILLGGACCIRGVYFLLLARGTVGDSTWGSVALMELPTFLLFSATTLVVLFWIVLADVKTQKKIGRVFMTAFLISNAAMYLLFMGFVVLFDRLGDRVTERCQGRLPTEVDHSRKRAVFLAYQSFIAVVAVLLAAAFVYGGIRLWVMLRSIQNTVSESEVITRLQITHCITAISIAVAFAGHAVFLFAVGVAVPGEPRLAAILMLLEVLPAAVILLRFVAQQGARLRSEGKASEETTYAQVMEEDTADF